MKFTLMILLLNMSLFADTSYAIQVISAKNIQSITKELIQKIEATKMSYKQDKRRGSHHIYMGSFRTWNEAKDSLEMIRKKVSPDAFICKSSDLERSKKEIHMAQARILEKKHAQVLPIEKIIIIEESADCKQTQEASRKEEISKALAFYRNSSYYTFNKE